MAEDSLEIQPEDVIHGRAIPPEMIRDLRVIAQLDARTVGRISEHLSTLQGFTAKESVKEGLKSCLQGANAETPDSILRTLLNLDQEGIDRIITTVGRWRQSAESGARIFSEELHLSLERNLRVLLSDYPWVDLLRKANRLLREVGNEFKSVAFFCDMRPVFDEPREKIEGFVTLANMRLIYVSQNGQRHACEVALTEDELKKLIEKSEKALSKMKVLKATSDQLRLKVKE